MNRSLRHETLLRLFELSNALVVQLYEKLVGEGGIIIYLVHFRIEWLTLTRAKEALLK